MKVVSVSTLQHPANDRGWARWAVVLAGVIPLVALVVAVWRYAVNVLYWDEWAVATVLPRYHLGRLRWIDLFVQHNESRMVVPRLLILALANASGGDVRSEMAATIALACVVSGGVWVLGRRTLPCGAGTRTAIWALANLLIFGLVQHENWLMGMQLVAELPVACLVGGLVMATSDRSVAARFVACMSLATVSTFSMAHGAICWVLLLPALWVDGARVTTDERARRVRWTWIYVAVFVSTLLVYFRDYHKPAGHPGLDEVLRQPASALAYALSFLGHPLMGIGMPRLGSAIAAGVVSLVVLVAIVLRIARASDAPARLHRAAPWLVVTAYALGSAAITTLGRLGFGLEQSLESRYTAYSSYLPLAILHLLVIARPPRWASVTVSAWIAIASVCTSIASLDDMAQTRMRRLQAAAVLRMSAVVTRPDEIARTLYPNVAQFQRVAAKLEQVGMMSPPRLADPHLDRIAGETSADAPSGFVDTVTRGPDGSLDVIGWAVLREDRRLADAVVLSYDDEQGRPVAFDLTTERKIRDDVAARENWPGYARSGFHVRVPADATSETRVPTIRAWAFDAISGKAFPLERSAASPSNAQPTEAASPASG
ncbi:MAG: hypothetical protein U0610_24955 [bacterium]